MEHDDKNVKIGKHCGWVYGVAKPQAIYVQYELAAVVAAVISHLEN